MSWDERAACSAADPNLFFPGQGEHAAAAKAICAGCPVQAPCLDFALRHPEAGIWGGTDERERRRLRRRYGIVPLRRNWAWDDPTPCGTLAAHRRHERNGEKPCELCLQAKAEYQRARRVAARSA